ncbi:tRNA (N6-isopentenyl adenosine(37)-C2)-methylthiotransferase MiaB [Desulfovibrio aerotolerans]|uniref:tRNA-2-methylthio-N(6)-dimethylallyladenosine synthase n=1 Tax=Solidesulfovibrio aerotolerans TaxID=295255 RepID=A0A7C9N3P7_9BACT|nr:tRNA (N6-isopentenyl adenosine(37)-C2)-methylthiotransferase MiaB [Solidesulfovibrio aerotolerans]MYL84751.1 tRNA (N6-isopentenyl adenosine(37)-C2)-methylthiotransferase MiaB [Solidesulfovibrio aerotolerans]
MKFHVTTMGCQMNVGDGDWLTRSLIAEGFTPASDADAELFILFTCSVRDKPEQKVVSEIGRIADRHRDNPNAFIAVGGCTAQQLGTALWRRFPMVRLVFGTDGIAAAPKALARLANEPGLRLSLLDFTESYPERDQSWPEEKLPPRAFVSIMQGCDNYCAYCIVPFVRGRQKSRPLASIIAECTALAARGVREVTLLGQNVNSYGLDDSGDGTSFAALLDAVAAVPGIARIRFTTSHPKDLDDAVIERFASLPALCPALHLPVQSGSDDILRRMGRRYDTAAYLALVHKLRRARPDIALTTDFIVGFPGETEADFQATLNLVRHVGFESGFSFMYSDRPGTASERLEPKISQEVKAARLAELQRLLDERLAASLAARVGQTDTVLIEGPSRRDGASGPSWRGRDSAGRIVNLPLPGLNDATGRLVRVRIVLAKKHSLLGEAEAEHD